MKLEIVYTAPYKTDEEKRAVEELRQKLYETYTSVLIYPNGLYEVRIVASNN